MIDDIVERLRLAPSGEFYRPSKWFELMLQAADEIERLTKQCEGLAQSAINNGQDLLLKEAEVERLRAALRVIADYSPGKDTTALLLRGYARAALEPKL